MRPPEPFTARPATLGDTEAVAALENEVDRAYVDEPDNVDATEVAGWWRRFELERDSLLVFGGDTLVAAGILDGRVAGTLDLDGYVHPKHAGRGLGAFLLGWLESEAARRGPGTLRTSVLAADEAARRLLTGRGYSPARRFYRMLVDLEGPPAVPAWPPGFTVSPFRAGEELTLHDVIEEAFADHWGHEPRSLESWQATTFGQEWWDPSLVYLVREGDEVVAAAINAVRFGVGWIGSLGTRGPWRGRGLGRALLLLSFRELYERGEHRIGLAVDSGNETGATHLYESVGMRVAWQADVYERQSGTR